MDKLISIFTERGIPRFVAEENQKFVEFFRAYLEYLERNLGEYDVVAHFLDYVDIDQTIDEFLSEYKKQYSAKFPESTATNFRLIIKKVREIYQTKGTEKSYELFFSLLFDTFVEFYYPKKDILRCSDGKWYIPYILVTQNTLPEVSYFLDKTISGSVSNAQGYVGEIVAYPDLNDPNTERYSLKLTERLGDFLDTDVITVTGETTPSLTLVTNGVVQEQGEWLDTGGFLSWDKKLQDNDYYQEFSYVLKTSLSKDVYEKLIKDLIHPAGMKMFGDVKYVDSKAYAVTDMLVVDIILALKYITELLIISDMNVLEANDSFTLFLTNYKQRSGLTDIDWKWADLHKETDPWLSLVFDTLDEWTGLTIDYITNNYPENFATVYINGNPASGWSLENDKLILASAASQADQIRIDFSLTGNSYTFKGNGTTDYLLPEMSKQFYHIPKSNIQII